MSIVIEHLNYVYMQGGPYETKALNDVSLTINDGEFIGLIGHTGSGKSTLAKQLGSFYHAPVLHLDACLLYTSPSPRDS